jgi:transglutaminase-like putative cysteine protease
MDTDKNPYLAPAKVINSDHPTVKAFARKHAGNASEPRELAVNFFYAIRDGIRYFPYAVDISVTGLRASTTVKNGHGWCVTKSALLAACCRASGIPARIGFADVKNHMTNARLKQKMLNKDIFYWHGYASIYIDGVWVKATPVFNLELCKRFRLKPLEFDGQNDALYHPFDEDGNQHMTYLNHRGEFTDVPVNRILNKFKKEYSEHLFKKDPDDNEDF